MVRGGGLVGVVDKTHISSGAVPNSVTGETGTGTLGDLITVIGFDIETSRIRFPPVSAVEFNLSMIG